MDALTSIAEEQRGFWKNVLVGHKGEGCLRIEPFKGDARNTRRIFPEFYVHMVAAGEASGNLDNVLGSMADFLESQASLRSKVRTSMIYPVFMVCVGFVVLSFLFAFVIPKITRIFKDTGSALPFITVVLIAVSDICSALLVALHRRAFRSGIRIQKAAREEQIIHRPADITAARKYSPKSLFRTFCKDIGVFA